MIMACSANAGEIVHDKFVSATLGREVNVTVYLPDGYKMAPGTFPVTYLLHGADEDENTWDARGGAAITLDGLIKRGLIRPTVAVMPSFGPASWWADGASEKAETAFMTDLIPYVEGKYKVATDRNGRALAGLSMGGYGSLNLALKHPDRFCAAGIISPAIYDPLPPETSASRRAPQFVRSGEFDPEAWKTLNYPAHLEAYARSATRVPMWIVSGDHDRLGIALMSAQLYWKLFQIQPKQVELRVVDGDHEWLTFREALPSALEYMDAQCSPSKRGESKVTAAAR